MQLIFEDKQKRVIKGREEIKFSSFSSFHLINVTARAKSAKQISKEATDDEDLIVKIDSKTFPVSAKNKRLMNSPAAFSGGQLHNLPKTVFFLTFLKGKDHTVTLITDEPHSTATFETLSVYTLELDQSLTLKIEKQAEDGNRRPWVIFALEDFPLASVAPTVTYSRRKRDSDDIKIIIDGKIQENTLRTIKYFLWRFAGSLLPKAFSTRTETETFVLNLPQGLHYIEFHADRMPILHTLTINFGEKPKPPIRIPTVDDPKWTGDFYDDTPEILLARLILGEAEGEPRETKIWITGTVLNRMKAKAWPNTIHEVILQPDQYDPLKISDPNFDKITNPLPENAGVERKNEWRESFEIAQSILLGKIKNPTEATHFHGRGVSKEWFLDNIVPNGRFITQIGSTYFYWSPN